MILSTAFLAISLSLDALGVGIAYGLRGIRIPMFPKLIICTFSILYSFFALLAGKSLAGVFPVNASKLIGTSILVIMGMWITIQAFTRKEEHDNATEKNFHTKSKTLFKVVLKSFGITIQVIRNPVEGDLDRSGIIDFSEAVLLGLALSVDAIGVGIGFAFTGLFSMAIPFAVGLFQLAFLYTGTYIGNKFAFFEIISKKALSILPGILLLLLAVLRYF